MTTEQQKQQQQNKDVSLRIRINGAEKDAFYTICTNMGMTPSKVVRKLIEEFCIKNEKTTNLL